MFLERSHPLRIYEIEGVNGDIHSFPGCDFVGREEFHQRLVELAEIIDATGSDPELLHHTHKRFRWVCDRILALHGIDKSWLNWDLLYGLLFADNATLVALNRPKGGSQQATGKAAKAQTIGEIIAILSESQGGIEEAIAVLTNYPADLVDEVLDAIANFHQTPEEKQKKEIQQWVEKKKTGAVGGKFKPGQQIKLPIPPTDEPPTEVA